MRQFVCRRVVAATAASILRNCSENGSSSSSSSVVAAATAATISRRHFGSSSSDAGREKEKEKEKMEIDVKKDYASFAVDRSGLAKGMEDELDDSFELAVEGKEEPTELARDLSHHIRMKGPISLHDYMAQAANHSLFGYYQHKLEKIGTGGDFITAPEISQLFGEMVGIWCVSQWKALGSPKKVGVDGDD